jgi:copper chaperone CopZ
MRPSLRLAALALALAAVLPGCSDEPRARPKKEKATPPPVTTAWRGQGEVVELSVWEMYCAGCEKQVEDAVGALEGVASVEADAPSSVVTVRLRDASLRDAAIPRIRDAVHSVRKGVLGEDPDGVPPR